YTPELRGPLRPAEAPWALIQGTPRPAEQSNQHNEASPSERCSAGSFCFMQCFLRVACIGISATRCHCGPLDPKSLLPREQKRLVFLSFPCRSPCAVAWRF